MQYDPKEFTLPDFKVVEIPIVVAPALGQFSTAEFPVEDLEYDYPALIESVVFTEDTLITENPDPGAGTSLLPFLSMRWWQDKDRAYGDHIPLIALDDRRMKLSVVDAPAAGAGYGQLVWEPKGPEDLVVRHQEALTIDWENPSVAVGPAFPAGTLNLTAHGYLRESGRPYALNVPVNFLVGAILPLPPIANTTNPTLAGRNMTGEEFVVKRITISVNSFRYPNLAADARIFRHLRLMPRLSGADKSRMSAYSQRAPLIAFGDLVTVNNHGVAMDFPNKLPIDTRGVIHFEFRNFNPNNGTQIIGIFRGWRRPQDVGR